MKIFLRVILWTAVIGWMGLIFSFSTENGVESAESSGGFIRYFLERLMPGFTDLTDAEQTAAIESFDHFTRKAAHFCIFAALGFLANAALWSHDLPMKRAFLAAFLIGALYAVSDEVHQAFVPGRACMIRDMLLDSCGVLTGCGVMTAVLMLYSKIKTKL